VKKISLIATTAASLALAPAALAQAPVPAPAPPPPPPPAAPPAPAAVTVGVQSKVTLHRRAYLVAGQPATFSGAIKPAVPGETLTVAIFNRHKRIGSRHVKVGKNGAFAVTMRAPKSGIYAVQADHPATPAQAHGKSPRVAFSTLTGHAGNGSRGENVTLLQRQLASLGYVTSRGGHFDSATGRAVLAFRKVNGMSRTQSANSKVFALLFAGRGGFRLRYASAGHHVEFDWSRQVVVFADHGRPQMILHASSGKPSTPTVFGTFSFYRKDPGTNSEGMVDSNYFIRGYAIHGYPSVPGYAASHGCIRIPIPDAGRVFAWVRLGDRIFVYR
jgi:L,D-transpeptidase catalytic domain/Putative peptidoglycan binding domain